MHILVTSPIPSHPQNHGNRARVFNVCQALQAMGHTLHYVYGGMEGLTPEQELAMRRAWDHVYIADGKRRQVKRSRGRHQLIDDWYIDSVTPIVRKVLDTWDIGACLANYVWFTAWLDMVPRGIPKLVDTHDIFGERHAALIKSGMEPSWYSTSVREERKGLNRADIVIGIQPEESEILRGRTKKRVVTLGHMGNASYLPVSAKAGQKLKVGYIASDNPINQHSLADFSAALGRNSHLGGKLDFFLAGAICGSDAGAASPFTKLGFVADLTEFYRDMDIILNPNIGGTGLKIKSVEALAFGKPLIATRDAMVGIETDEPVQLCADADALCAALDLVAGEPDRLPLLAAKSRSVYDHYQAEQAEMLARLFPVEGEVS